MQQLLQTQEQILAEQIIISCRRMNSAFKSFFVHFLQFSKKYCTTFIKILYNFYLNIVQYFIASCKACLCKPCSLDKKEQQLRNFSYLVAIKFLLFYTYFVPNFLPKTKNTSVFKGWCLINRW